MSTESEANDRQDGEPGDAIGLSELEQQIADRMAQLYAAAEEYYKLQILLDTIDGRERLAAPEYLAPLLPEPEPVDEQRRLQARRRAAERSGRLKPRRRKPPER
jgi:hypothetical protein